MEYTNKYWSIDEMMKLNNSGKSRSSVPNYTISLIPWFCGQKMAAVRLIYKVSSSNIFQKMLS
jgi:hypothetical protein